MEEKLIIITVENFSRAQLLKIHLESEGIECYLSDLNLIQASVSEGVRVMVKETDVKRAIKVYLKIKTQYKRDGKRRLRKANRIRRILVPVDFSENSYKTACFALEIGHIYSASVRFLHVYYSPAIDMITTPDVNISQFNLDVVLNEISHRAKEEMKVFMDKMAHYLADNTLIDAKPSYRVMEGIATDTIFNAAESYKPGLIVMGNHGQTDTNNAIFGSVVWKVLQKSKIPVLSVPESSSFDNSQKVYNIMFTTDLDDVDYKTIRKLIVILSPIKNINLHCVHASDKPINEFQKAKMEEIKSYLSSVIACPLSFNFLESKENDYIGAFDKYVKSNKIDLICMSTRKRGIIERFFNPSLAKKMLYHSTTPLMIIHV